MENNYLKAGDVCLSQGKHEENVNQAEAAKAYSLSALNYLKGVCKEKCPDVDDKQLDECNDVESAANILQKHGIKLDNERLKKLGVLFALYVVPVPSVTLNVAKDVLFIKEAASLIKGMVADSKGEEDAHSKAEEIRKQLPEAISSMYTDEEIIELYKEAKELS